MPVDDDDRERVFYEIRSRAFGGRKVAPHEIDALFSDPVGVPSISALTVFSSTAQYASQALKMGWLLGRNATVVTPHFAYRYRHTEVTQRKSYPEVMSVDGSFFEWKEALAAHEADRSIRLVPSVLVDLSKVSDEIENWSQLETTLVRSNVHAAPLVLESLELKTPGSITMQVPQLLIDDIDLVKRVQRDYPAAAEELRKLVADSFQYASKNAVDASPSEILATICKEIVAPGVARIERVRKDRSGSVGSVEKLSTRSDQAQWPLSERSGAESAVRCSR